MTLALCTLAAGFVIGWLGQRSRMCFIGGYRDHLLVRDKQLLKGTLAFFLGAWRSLRLPPLFHFRAAILPPPSPHLDLPTGVFSRADPLPQLTPPTVHPLIMPGVCGTFR